MTASPTALDLADPAIDVVELTRRVCDIPSVSGDERALADAVEAALRALPGLEVVRDGDAVVARTALGRAERVLLAGHLDTVPLTDPPNLPVRREQHPVDGDVLVGRGTCDMKGGVAVQLALARRVAAAGPAAPRDVTFVFYDHEEVEAARNGLGRLARNAPHLLAADFAVLLEPSSAVVEGGCNGTLRAEVTTTGKAAHSARAWRGSNAIHAAAPVLARLAAYQPREVEVEGLVFREGLNAVAVSGGIAGNVIPDRCVVTVNYRFAPAVDSAGAEAHVREVFEGFEVAVTDAADGAVPGLHLPAAADFVRRTGTQPLPKYGWTDVARFSALGVPAVNYGPGDNATAHADDERCRTAEVEQCLRVLTGWLLEGTGQEDA
ncbi:succinyl-diaminopimelate desuccinylase [Kineococcus radiotolerans]|uniref:Succinyl-diaminopimelate desuccinylase n=1 Tax=Kineococcus radiotolerans (strain ATCC BAA-149 / DSM 14245 / SRS30216) TaxID=266940 RepID=A6W742_KINRD|nr:succinyl-diaminopimelate desuccinylase [Kineococcus radiotolerans]ABS02631.1 succinyl-diaminopimelate desuccinylase [Kineococcus radiotolerans SRS30216 = ATCC BAA-149]